MSALKNVYKIVDPTGGTGTILVQEGEPVGSIPVVEITFMAGAPDATAKNITYGEAEAMVEALNKLLLAKKEADEQKEREAARARHVRSSQFADAGH